MTDTTPAETKTTPAPTEQTAQKTTAATEQPKEPVQAAKTVLEDTGDKTAVAPADWPEDWREKLAGNDEKLLGRLKRYASPANFAKAFDEAQRKISSGEYKRQGPPKEANEEDLAAWRKENGIPEKPEGYLEGIPDGVVVGEDDKELIGLFAADMHTKNATPEVVHAAIESYYKILDRVHEEQAENDVLIKDRSEDELRGEWGNEYRRNVTIINSFLDTAPEGVKDGFLGARLPSGAPLASDANILRFLLKAAMETNPAATVVPGSGAGSLSSIDDEIKKLEGMMGNRRSEYWSGPSADKNQARYRELIAARDRLSSGAA